MQRLGIVDLGSNTARLVVFEFEPERRKRRVRVPARYDCSFSGHDGYFAQRANLGDLFS